MLAQTFGTIDWAKMRIVLIATGGTISSVTREDGSRSPLISGEQLLASAGRPEGLRVEVRNLPPRASYSFSLGDMSTIVDAVQGALDGGADGVVVTHGTDTLEETALLADIRLSDSRPVVFTGAQRSSDAPDADGMRNLGDALTVSASTCARNRGVLISFGGRVLGARGSAKIDTTATEAFHPTHGTDLGCVSDGAVEWSEPAASTARTTPHLPGSPTEARVDILHVYSGMGSTLVDASIAAGARGIIFVGSGSGNGNPELLAQLRKVRTHDITAVLTSRVPSGLLEPRYAGHGGGRDLVDAGAVLAPNLRAAQARILLACLLTAHASEPDITAAFTLPVFSLSTTTPSHI